MADGTNTEGRSIDEGGRYTTEVTPDAVLDLFDEIRGPVVTAGDVADAFDCSAETARRKLRKLEADGRVDSRESRRRIFWWRTGDER